MNKDRSDLKKQLAKFPDTEIIRRIISGQPELYEILIRRYNPYLYRIGRGYGFNHHDTEDAMQECYVSAYLNLAGFEERSSFKTWLVRIMLHQCYRTKNRSSYLQEVLSESQITESSTPVFTVQPLNREDTMINKELGYVLENALARIPEEYRMVFLLRELNGQSVAETAVSLNITEANVKVRLNRAKKMLSREVEKMYRPEDIYEFNLVYCDRIVERVMREIGSGKVH